VRPPITEMEIRMTARERLARAIGLFHPLTEVDVEDLCDSGLVDESDFRAVSSDPPTYTYCGDRWTVEYRDGRPRLIPSISVPPDTPRSAVAEEEARCALVMDVLGLVKGAELTDAEIAEYRADAWGPVLDEARRRDEEEPGRGSAAIEWHERQGRRLQRAREVIDSPPIRPYTTQGGGLDHGDEWKLHRYMILTVCRIDESTGECRVDHAEDIEAVLAEVAQLVTDGRALLRIFDLDDDEYQSGVEITVHVCLADSPDTSHERTV
jgi:hypothetical protein